mmetsp:Transcript_74746/g.178365  ORF Transcript_74746/g.178365 Transcript_74746/m.178365 type:complete len:274 (+) Transcript_74746:774-1595(+)
MPGSQCFGCSHLEPAPDALLDLLGAASLLLDLGLGARAAAAPGPGVRALLRTDRSRVLRAIRTRGLCHGGSVYLLVQQLLHFGFKQVLGTKLFQRRQGLYEQLDYRSVTFCRGEVQKRAAPIQHLGIRLVHQQSVQSCSTTAKGGHLRELHAAHGLIHLCGRGQEHLRQASVVCLHSHMQRRVSFKGRHIQCRAEMVQQCRGFDVTTAHGKVERSPAARVQASHFCLLFHQRVNNVHRPVAGGPGQGGAVIDVVPRVHKGALFQRPSNARPVR